ncbi:hypothetical protein QYM36_018263 [Artemia franciscana]|uniref:DUF4371 domain-containing protein n=1 Tax=Artemia franciscana TaxID=6661 RepID=A0AA88HCW3_ARTSF|nr:hypothetical protein QYM36_018263 [Artemia franciscana]
MKEAILFKIKESVDFSIRMNTAIGISGNDRVVWFVHGPKVVERLLSLECVRLTSTEALLVSLRDALEEVGIAIEHCVATDIDGASNMSGAYNGLTAKNNEHRTKLRLHSVLCTCVRPSNQ